MSEVPSSRQFASDDVSVRVIIPALNEERAIRKVIEDIPDWISSITVVDNGSTDQTAERAKQSGARVVHEPEEGYGAACLAGLSSLEASTDIVVFLDGDYSDDPTEMGRLVHPLLKEDVDLVIGSRSRGSAEPGALSPQARWGNALACILMKLFWRKSFTDLGPFRAIRMDALRSLHMRDRDYGWTVEMQVKALRRGLSVREVPVSYRPRIGTSKITGTVSGVLGAGYKILWTLFYYAFLAPEPDRE